MTALLVAGVLVGVLGQGPGRRVPMAGAVLTSATNFTLSGSVSALTPGQGSTLTLNVTNPYSVGISVGSVTVAVLASGAPAGCPMSKVSIDGISFPSAPSGSPSAYAVTISAPTSPLPVAVAHNGSNTIPLPILLDRSAGNGCQSVTFPFSYSATAAYTATTTTALASSPNPSSFGQSVTFTASVSSTVSPDPGEPTPVGTVTFYRCTNPATLNPGSPASACTTSVVLGGPIAVNGSGQATFATPTLAVGSYAIFATFSPTDSTNFTASSSTSITQVVNKASTTLALTTTPNPSNFGQAVTLTAQTTPGSGPTGTVSFYSCATATCTSTSLLGTGTLNPSGKAPFTISALPPFTDYLLAVYAGDGSYLGSTSNTVTQTINFSSPCIVTTINGGFTVAPNQAICIMKPGRVNGGITVKPGGALYLNGAVVNGGITSTGAAALRFCGSTISGNVTVSSSTGFVMIGDGGDDGPPGCAPNSITGALNLSSNKAGFEVAGNSIVLGATFTANTGSQPTSEIAAPEVEGNKILVGLICATSNSPALSNGGQANSVVGLRTGQCVGTF